MLFEELLILCMYALHVIGIVIGFCDAGVHGHGDLSFCSMYVGGIYC